MASNIPFVSGSCDATAVHGSESRAAFTTLTDSETKEIGVTPMNDDQEQP